MSDKPEKLEIEMVGCLPWLLYFGLVGIALAIGRLADAVGRLQ